jgi:hypothetical protein
MTELRIDNAYAWEFKATKTAKMIEDNWNNFNKATQEQATYADKILKGSVLDNAELEDME